MKKAIVLTLNFGLFLFCGGCKKEDSGELPAYEVARLKRLEVEAAIYSKILGHDDSSFHLKSKRMWPSFRPAQQAENRMPTEYDSVSKHIYIGVIDKYFPAQLSDSSFLDFRLTKYGVSKKHLDAYLSNRDRSGFEVPLYVKHRYVFIREEDYDKPHFSLRDVDNKYVRKFCVVRFSKPTLNDDGTESLTFYENLWAGKAAVYYSRLENGKWHISTVASVIPTDQAIP